MLNAKDFKEILDRMFFIGDDLDGTVIEYKGLDIALKCVDGGIWEDFGEYKSTEKVYQFIEFVSDRVLSDTYFVIQDIARYDDYYELEYSQPILMRKVSRTVVVEDFEEVLVDIDD